MLGQSWMDGLVKRTPIIFNGKPNNLEIWEYPSGRTCLYMATGSGRTMDYPIRYADGRICYDEDNSPKYLKIALVKELDRARNAGVPYSNDYYNRK